MAGRWFTNRSRRLNANSSKQARCRLCRWLLPESRFKERSWAAVATGRTDLTVHPPFYFSQQALSLIAANAGLPLFLTTPGKGRHLPKRSEERRVGKECRSRWWSDHYNKKRNGWRVVVYLVRM